MQWRDGSIRYLLVGTFRQMAFKEWGGPAGPLMMCVHGVTRDGLDFDALAEAFQDPIIGHAPALLDPWQIGVIRPFRAS